MKHKTIPANIVEPELITEWQRLNKEVFDNRIELEPTSLVWHHDIRKLGGYCQYPNTTTEVRIAIKITLKDNYQAWRLMLCHEMIHQLLYQTWRICPEIGNYSRGSFTGDQSSSFMVEVYNISRKLGVSFQELAFWHVKDEDVSLKDQSQKQYYERKEMTKKGAASKARLFG